MTLNGINLSKAVRSYNLTEIQKPEAKEITADDKAKSAIKNFDRVDISKQGTALTDEVMEIKAEHIRQDNLEHLEEELSQTEEKPVWKLQFEAAEWHNEKVKMIILEADVLGLRYGAFNTYFQNRAKEMKAELREKNPAVFAALIQNDAHFIETGRHDLASLPSDFTMDDYNYYMDKYIRKKEPEKAPIIYA